MQELQVLGIKITQVNDDTVVVKNEENGKHARIWERVVDYAFGVVNYYEYNTEADGTEHTPRNFDNGARALRAAVRHVTDY
jgi:hypothetical protein